MFEVNLSKMPDKMTVMLYGDSRSGKSVFCASWPRPIFFMDPVEQGWVSLQTMNPDWFYDPKIKPVAWAWEKPTDMQAMIGKLNDQLKKTPGKFQTLVIDQVTWYFDFIFRFMEERQSSGGKVDRREIYGNLKTHMQNLVAQLHALPLNVIWVALAKKADDGSVGIHLPGQTADYLPAQCQHWLYQRSAAEKPGAPLSYFTHTRRYGAFPAGCRDGGRLPAVLEESSYRSFATAMGLI